MHDIAGFLQVGAEMNEAPKVLEVFLGALDCFRLDWLGLLVAWRHNKGSGHGQTGAWCPRCLKRHGGRRREEEAEED
jgi:hypothetical protein